MDDLDTTYTTVSGITIKIKPVSPLTIQKIQQAVKREFEKRNEPLARPTYILKTSLGDEETFEHDEKTLETDEDREAWGKFIDANTRLRIESEERLARFMKLDGIEYDAPDDEWQKLQKYMGLEIPTDPFELKIHYLDTEILRTPKDQNGVIERILVLSSAGMPQEALDAVRASFRSDAAGLDGGRSTPVGVDDPRAWLLAQPLEAQPP